MREPPTRNRLPRNRPRGDRARWSRVGRGVLVVVTVVVVTVVGVAGVGLGVPGGGGGAVRADSEPPPSLSDDDDAPPRDPVWRYRGPDGRLVFTDRLSGVPRDAREVREVDLNAVSLNVALGNDLQDRLAEELDRLGLRVDGDPVGGALPPGDERLDAAGVAEALSLEQERARLLVDEGCAEVRGDDAPGEVRTLLERLFTDHVHLPVLAVFALVLIGLGPAMSRRLGAPQWVRLITFLLPLLGFLAFTTSTAVEAARLRRRFQEAVRACDPERSLGPLDSARALSERLELVDTLRVITTRRGL